MSNEIYIAKQETLLETKTKVEAVQTTVNEIAQKPNNGGGQIVFPSLNYGTGQQVVLPSLPDANYYITIQGKHTQSGHLEVHMFKTTSPVKYYIIDFELKTITEQPTLPFSILDSIIAVSGKFDAEFKRIHVLGSSTSGQTASHHYLNTKNRNWVTLSNFPIAIFTGGAACGESYDSNLVDKTDFDNLVIQFINSSCFYKWDASSNTCTRISTWVQTNPQFSPVMTRYTDSMLAISGGKNSSTGVYNNDSIYFFVSIYGSTGGQSSASNPLGACQLGNSCGCIFKYNEQSGVYYVSGSVVNTIYVDLSNTSGVRKSFFTFYGVTYSFYLSTLRYYEYRYRVYLPKGTKIHGLPYLLTSSSLLDRLRKMPTFIDLSVIDDAFVIDNNSFVYYLSSDSTLNLNNFSTSQGNALDTDGGFYIEIGSGE